MEHHSGNLSRHLDSLNQLFWLELPEPEAAVGAGGDGPLVEAIYGHASHTTSVGCTQDMEHSRDISLANLRIEMCRLNDMIIKSLGAHCQVLMKLQV